MKRLMLLALATLLVLPAASNAVDMSGKWGLGFFDRTAPVGARIWATPQLGLDLGVGFESLDQGEESGTNFYIEVGAPYVLVPTERANFYLRPGVLVGFFDEANNASVESFIEVTLAPGVELFFGDHFSLEAAHGIAVLITNYREVEGEEIDSETDFFTFGANATFLGFHFYFQ